jgi:hypothetical protein
MAIRKPAARSDAPAAAAVAPKTCIRPAFAGLAGGGRAAAGRQAERLRTRGNGMTTPIAGAAAGASAGAP